MVYACIGLHFYGDSGYDYTEGIFFTIADPNIKVVDNPVNVMSSGQSLGLMDREKIIHTIKQYMKLHITNFKSACITTYTNIPENDYKFCHSGPPSGGKGCSSDSYDIVDGHYKLQDGSTDTYKLL